jgi:pimeloyl-ACP methyl ester carboxylesterase
VAADSAYTASPLGQIDGPVLLAGHSHGGAVITNAAASAPNVVGLVFVAAFAPEEGETLADVESGSKDSVLNTALVQYTYPAGPPETTTLMAATQRPVAAAAFTEARGPPTWRRLPCWAVVAAGDKAAGADVVRSHAQRGDADIVEVEGSHVIMISQPQNHRQVRTPDHLGRHRAQPAPGSPARLCPGRHRRRRLLTDEDHAAAAPECDRGCARSLDSAGSGRRQSQMLGEDDACRRQRHPPVSGRFLGGGARRTAQAR